MLERAKFNKIISSAARAPSVHNTQPARFQWIDSSTIKVYGDKDRILMVSDPTFRDHFISLGAACEGVVLALSAIGMKSSVDYRLARRGDVDLSQPLHVAAVVRITGKVSNMDPLAGMVGDRHSYRGIFRRASESDMMTAIHGLERTGDALILTGNELIGKIADLYTQASNGFLADFPYADELFRWLRLSKSHPLWSRDGLNGECMSLHPVEQFVARFLMRPTVLPTLLRLKIGKFATSEAAQIKSAAFLMGLVAAQNEHPMETGRRFYRLWLTLASFGFAACPLSAMTDCASTAEALHALIEESQLISREGKRLIIMWRCGQAPRDHAKSPRLPVEELIVEA